MKKDEAPTMMAHNFSALMDLDKTLNRYFYDGKSFIRDGL
jgi:hypothetical protein